GGDEDRCSGKASAGTGATHPGGTRTQSGGRPDNPEPHRERQGGAAIPDYPEVGQSARRGSCIPRPEGV
ncbi:MAG: hypothetical protein AVDCRST_MAG05-741, partial [uncultured Rubrobacteraceae bacterium]